MFVLLVNNKMMNACESPTNYIYMHIFVGMELSR